MPPKKNKATPVVVGTVSTRSTRRESIVNIQIVPKARKTSQKKETKIVKPKIESKAKKKKKCELSSSKPATPEIFQILNEWSDDETSKNENTKSVDQSCSTSATKLPEDEQNLIDILEGTHPDSLNDLSMTNIGIATSSPLQIGAKKFVSTENAIVNIESPQRGEEQDIIEECVVEDNSIIIESPENQLLHMQGSEDQSPAVDKVEEVTHLTSGNLENSEENAVISENAAEDFEATTESVVCEDSMELVVSEDKVVSTNLDQAGLSTVMYHDDSGHSECVIESPTKSTKAINEEFSIEANLATGNSVPTSEVFAASNDDDHDTVYTNDETAENNPIDQSVEADLCEQMSESVHISGESPTVVNVSNLLLEESAPIMINAPDNSDNLQFEMSKMSLASLEPPASDYSETDPQNLKADLQYVPINESVKIASPEKHIVLISSDKLIGKRTAKSSPKSSPLTPVERKLKKKSLSRSTSKETASSSPEIGQTTTQSDQTSTLTFSDNSGDVKMTPIKVTDIRSKLEALYAVTDQGDIDSKSTEEEVSKKSPEIENTASTEICETQPTSEAMNELPNANDEENVIIWRIPRDSPKKETKLADCWFVKPPRGTFRPASLNTTNLQLIDETIDEVLRKYTSDDCDFDEIPATTSTSNLTVTEEIPSSSKGLTSELSQSQDSISTQASFSSYVSSPTSEKSLFSCNSSFSSLPQSSPAQRSSSGECGGASFSGPEQVTGVVTGQKGVSPVTISKNKATTKESKPKQPKDPKNKKLKKEIKNIRDEEVRRSDRIKTIPRVKKKSHGLVKSRSEPNLDIDNSDSNSMHMDIDKQSPTASPRLSKADKTKSRSKSSDNLEIAGLLSSSELSKPSTLEKDEGAKAEIEARLKTFVHLKENVYKTDRQTSKEAKGMICDCYLAEEDIQNNEFGCGEDCLNRLLMIECGELCQVRSRCTNKRFQKGLFAPVEIFKTDKKGLGLRAAANIAYGEFILEYVGEVLNPDEFDKRAEVYSKDKNIHFYFMSLRADAIIDATNKGNISRFINHSCDPNAETQKWTVNGELRIGFFSTRTILAGEEITFDYRFQRYGKEAQRCYCEASTCRGWLGDSPNESEDEEDEEEEEEETVKLLPEPVTAEIKIHSDVNVTEPFPVLESNKMEIDPVPQLPTIITTPEDAATQLAETPKKASKKKVRKEVLYEEIDQLNEDIEMLLATGLKNQAHTLKLSRLMVRAKDLEQRKKLLRILRRGELACRRLFLDYHGLRLMHGYMIDAQQLKDNANPPLEVMQTKLEVLQTLAVLPIQNKTMLIESKVLPAVKKWSKNEDIVEDGEQKYDDGVERVGDGDPEVKEKIEEIKFLASKLLEEWANLKESFRIPKRQRIEQMKEHEKEANKKFMESSSQEKESSRKNEQRSRSWSRYKSERETNKRSSRQDDRDKPSAEFLKISKHERRKLFALQMEVREEERRMKQRELWRQHEMNCLLIGADPRFTAPFDPGKGFQYIWNPSLGQWQALPVPSSRSQGPFGSPAGGTQGSSSKQHVINPFASPMISVPGTPSQYPGIQSSLPPMVPGIAVSLPNPISGVAASLPTIASNLPNPIHGLAGIPGTLPTMPQPGMPAVPIYQEVKEDPSQVKFAGPIPPPVKLPPKWKCAKDKYGRPYYYHVKIRKSQWEPPPLPEPVIEEESSESTSSESLSSSTSGSDSDSDSDEEIDDSRLLQEVRRQIEVPAKSAHISALPVHIKREGSDSITPSPEVKTESDDDDLNLRLKMEETEDQLSSIDIRLKEQFNWDVSDSTKKKKRVGLCQEIIISPRTEADRLQSKEDLKRYKATKEKLKRQKEQLQHQVKKKLKLSNATESLRRSREKKGQKSTVKTKIKELNEWNDEHAKKIKEVFRSTMAHTVVGVLNAYRKPECKEARIVNTEDFKHLARKLTHFVMLKEMKHIPTIDDLVCSDNVKAKAKEYIRKYMSKFGDTYQKRHDEPDFKD